MFRLINFLRIAPAVLLALGPITTPALAVSLEQDELDRFEIVFDYRGGNVMEFSPVGSSMPGVAKLEFDGRAAASRDNLVRRSTVESIFVGISFPDASGLVANWFAFRLSGLTLNPGETRVYGAADFGVLDPSAFAEGIGLFPGFDQTTLTLTRDDSVLPRITADDDGWRGSLVLSKFAVPESGCSSLLLALGFVGVCALRAFLRPSPKTEQASLWSQTRPPRAGKCMGAAAGAWHTAALRVAQASCLWCRTGILPVSAGCKPALPDRRGTCSTNRFTERARWNSSRKADPPQPA